MIATGLSQGRNIFPYLRIITKLRLFIYLRLSILVYVLRGVTA